LDAKDLDIKILTMETMPDHIHVLIECKPQCRISDAPKAILQGGYSLNILKPKSNFWVVIYGIHLTVSERTKEQITNTRRRSNFMKIYSTYSVKIKKYNRIFSETVSIYRNAVHFLMQICLAQWQDISVIKGNQTQMIYVESISHKTKANPFPKYNFDSKFYKMPSYIRRASISEAIGKVSSYLSNLKNWQSNPVGKEPAIPHCGYVYPSLYRGSMYNLIGNYTAQIKIYHNHTW